MKNSLITSLVGYLIEKEYFNLISSETEELDFKNGTVSLIKDFHGTSVLLEIIDADRLNSQDIAVSMGHGAALVHNINGSNATMFKLFLFESGAAPDKLDIITQGQVDIEAERKFLKAFSVNSTEGTVQKHYKVPNFDANICRAVKSFFSRNYNKKEVSMEDIRNLIEKRKKDYEIELKAKKPWLTYGLIITNILVWLVIKFIAYRSGQAYGSLLEPFGGKVNSLILQGQYWRFFTPMFLHADEIHLAVNCYSLFIVGSQVERLFGQGRFIFIYVVAGILGNIASFAFTINAAVGASGAIFGLLGAMLFFAIKRPSLLRSSFGANLITTVVINLAYGFMSSQIDNNAHLGGFAGGFLTTGIVYIAKEENKRDKLVKAVSLVMAIVVFLAGILYGFNNQNNRIVPMLTELQTMDKKRDWVRAENTGEDILDLKPSDKSISISVLWSVTRAEIKQKKYQEGIIHAGQLVKISPADGHYLLGIIYFYTAQYDIAREHLQKAKELESPNTETINQILSEIEARAK